MEAIKIKCKGWDKGLLTPKIVECGKTITRNNSCEESRDLNMCEKCFCKLCNFCESLGG